MKDLIAIIVYAICKAQLLTAELFGYWFIILIWLSVCGLGVTTSGLIWITVLAVALFALNHTLIRWTETEVYQ